MIKKDNDWLEFIKIIGQCEALIVDIGPREHRIAMKKDPVYRAAILLYRSLVDEVDQLARLDEE